eukprot:superscaffoldBa00001179_g9366
MKSLTPKRNCTTVNNVTSASANYMNISYTYIPTLKKYHTAATNVGRNLVTRLHTENTSHQTGAFVASWPQLALLVSTTAAAWLGTAIPCREALVETHFITGAKQLASIIKELDGRFLLSPESAGRVTVAVAMAYTRDFRSTNHVCFGQFGPTRITCAFSSLILSNTCCNGKGKEHI